MYVVVVRPKNVLLGPAIGATRYGPKWGKVGSWVQSCHQGGSYRSSQHSKSLGPTVGWGGGGGCVGGRQGLGGSWRSGF